MFFLSRTLEPVITEGEGEMEGLIVLTGRDEGRKLGAKHTSAGPLCFHTSLHIPLLLNPLLSFPLLCSGQGSVPVILSSLSSVQVWFLYTGEVRSLRETKIPAGPGTIFRKRRVKEKQERKLTE